MAEVSAGPIRCSKRHPTPDHCLPQSKANLHLCMRVVRSAGRQGNVRKKRQVPKENLPLTHFMQQTLKIMYLLCSMLLLSKLNYKASCKLKSPTSVRLRISYLVTTGVISRSLKDS